MADQIFLSKNQKGFMHAVEGVLSALILLFYLLASAPPLQKNEWTPNSFKQSGTEYLESIERAKLSQVLVEHSDDFSDITNNLFETSNIVIATRGLPLDYIKVGVVTNHSDDKIIYFSAAMQMEGACDASGWETEIGCIINDTEFSEAIILVDSDNGVPDNVFIYDSIYVDLNGDNDYDPGEGPFYTNDNLTIGANSYYIGNIDNSTKSVALWDFTPIEKYIQTRPTINLNGKNTTFLFYGTDFSYELSHFDILLISDSVDISPYANKLKDFLRQGKGIVEIANMTDSNYNPDQSDLFGVVKTDYNEDIIGNKVYLSKETRMKTEYNNIANYFSGISVIVPMFTPASPPYDVSDLPTPSNVRVGLLNVSGRSINIAIAKRASPIYDSVYVDSNSDYNFSEPASDSTIYYPPGKIYSFPYGNIKEISSLGLYTTIWLSSGIPLVDFFNPLKIDSNQYSEAVALQENVYKISFNNIGDSFSIIFSNLPVLGDNSTLLPGNYTHGRIVPAISNIAGREYNLSITNTSKSLFFNIDLNDDLKYNGYGEGPFADGALVAIGPEDYRIDFIDESKITFRFESRKKIPAAIASEKYKGRTVWMPDINDTGYDSKNFVLASILWASPKKFDETKFEGHRNIIAVRKGAVLSEDMYQPYIIELYRPYE